MLDEFITRAKNDESVFIDDVMSAFSKGEHILHIRILLATGGEKHFDIRLPLFDSDNEDHFNFLKEYVYARLYNAISVFGGKKLYIGIAANDSEVPKLLKDLNDDFGVNLPKAERTGYGKCLNVTDRVNAAVGCVPFSFEIGYDVFESKQQAEKKADAIENFRNAVKKIEKGYYCGIDVGGTDIKVVASRDGHIAAVKEYDWNPALFTCAEQMITPIVTMLRAVRCVLSLENVAKMLENERIQELLDKDTDIERMDGIISKFEADYPQISFNGVGVSYPDVVINHEIVGGETLKTKGIRDNSADYEFEFGKFKRLGSILRKYCVEDAEIHMANDGSLAAYTAAVEWAWDNKECVKVPNGVFAHTLGTELGTGWIDQTGSIPQIPLEVYNCIIDLGSYKARTFDPFDVRSTLNFNTGIAGTLQKYTSQYGAYRMAIKLFQGRAHEEYSKLFDLGYLEKQNDRILVKTQPQDMRKPLLEYLMQGASDGQPEMEEAFRRIGECLAVTWKETDYLLEPKVKSRVLFGRFVKKEKCFNLMCEGANRKHPVEHYAADSSLAYTPLMLQLSDDPVHTIAQFGQAVGAIYYSTAIA